MLEVLSNMNNHNLDALDTDFSGASSAAQDSDAVYKAERGPVDKRKALIAGSVLAGAVVLTGGAFAAISLTGADWTDQDTDNSAFSTGAFEIEISTDYGDSWNSGTDTDDFAGLTLADVADDFAFEAGDNAGTTFQVRAANTTTHNGVIDASEIEGVFNVDDEIDGDFTYTIIDRNEELLVEGVITDGEDAVTTAEGSVEVPADQEPVSFLLIVEASEDLPASEEQYELEAAWNIVAYVAEGTQHSDNDG